MADLSDQITDAAQNPKKAQGDMGSAESHPLPDLIAADRYLAGRSAATGPRRGIRFTRLVPGGTVPDQST